MLETKLILEKAYGTHYEEGHEQTLISTKAFDRKVGKTHALSNIAKENNLLYVCSSVNLCEIGDEISGGLEYKSVNQLLRQDGLSYKEFIIDEIFDYEYEKLREYYPTTKMFGIVKSDYND